MQSIDAPAIEKSIIMVRNYKRPSVGRMEWVLPVGVVLVDGASPTGL